MSDPTSTTSSEGIPSHPEGGLRGEVDHLRGASAMPFDEIEALLRLARSSVSLPVSADEELGPGDLQHYRGITRPAADAQSSNLTSATGSDSPPVLSSPALEQRSIERPSHPPEVHGAIVTPGRSVVTPKERGPSTSSATSRIIEDLNNLELDIAVELGHTELFIEDILKLQEGSVVSLDRMAGEMVDITANGKLIARGELLVIDGKFGVRLSEIL